MAQRFAIIMFLLALAEFYSFIVVRSAVRTLPYAGRVGVMVFYVLLSLFAWISFFMFRHINWANLPHMLRNIYVATTIGFMVGKVLILVVMLIDELRRLFTWIVTSLPTLASNSPSAGANIGRSIFLQRAALLLGGVALGGFIWGITNRYRYKVRRVRLAFGNLPESFKGMKIVQISDIHSGSFDKHEAVARGVKLVMAENPDVIFFTGDLVNNKADEIQPYTDIFSQLKAPMGVYSTLGNHDYGDYIEWPSVQAKSKNLEWLKETHGKMGWRLLMNEHVLLERGNDKIAVLGIENWSAKANFPKYGDLSRAHSGVGPDIPFKILLSHDPSHWDAQVRKQFPDINLTLAGHTHGMQFGVEIPGLKWSPVQYVYQKWAGLYREGAQYLYVNRGFGFLGYPGRLGIMPEITVIELV
ncbi:metallophosphoesterase [Polluticoccus soli]|uniref:metallophosphoesterase n=1 Tax=Polluticoccus soli TaxID=3034150 RepID=UPI0023E2347E|nr:metallophosphoesterase [Flavipsychrobacter sp. JY13-12]